MEMELKGIGMLDDSRWKEIVQKGYDQMKDALKNVPESERFW